MLRPWLCVAMVSLGVSGPAAPTPEAAVSALVGALNTHDARGAAELFAEDGEWLPPDGAPARGREAVGQALVVTLRTLHSVDTLTRTVEIAGTLAVVRGRLTASHRTVQLGTDVTAGSYVVVLRRTSDGWRIAACLFNLPMHPDVIG